jgi:hypothetical protein
MFGSQLHFRAECLAALGWRLNGGVVHHLSLVPICALQSIFSVFIFVLLASEDGFKTKWHKDEEGILRAPAVYNGEPPCRLPCV